MKVVKKIYADKSKRKVIGKRLILKNVCKCILIGLRNNFFVVTSYIELSITITATTTEVKSVAFFLEILLSGTLIKSESSVLCRRVLILSAWFCFIKK